MKRWLKTLLIITLTFGAVIVSGQESRDPDTSRNMEDIIKHLSLQLKQRTADSDFSDISRTLFQMDINAALLDSIMNSFPLADNTDFSLDSLFRGETGISFRELLSGQQYTEREGIVKFGGDAVVGRNEMVRGDVVIIGGDAVVYGQVRGGIVVVLGNIRLASTSYVQDDVIAIWGSTSIDDGAHISGKTSVFNFGQVIKDTMSTGILSHLFLIFRLIRMAIFFLIAYAVLKAFPDAVSNIGAAIETNYVKSMLIGLLGLLLIPAIFIVLCATILGIPVAVLLLPIAVIGAFILGGTSISLLAGRFLAHRLGIQSNSQAVFLALGIGILELPSLLGRTSLFFSSIISTFFFIVTLALFIAVWTPGFGGVLITRFGRKSY